MCNETAANKTKQNKEQHLEVIIQYEIIYECVQ